MRLRNIFLTTVSALALTAAAGCESGFYPGGGGTPIDEPGSPTPGGDGPGLAEFNSSIKPMVAGCGTGGEGLCHTGIQSTDPSKFLGAGPDTGFYTAIKGFAQVHGNWDIAQASLVTKLDLDGTHYTHDPWTDEERAKIQAWFDIEKAAPQDPTTPGGPVRGDTRQLMAEWSACMNLADWDASGMGNWADKGTNNGACSNCHNEGQFWINVNPDNATMFEMNRYELFIPGFFAAKMNPDGTGEIIPAYDKLVRMGQGNPGGSLHPVYDTDIENDEYFQYLTNFHQLTAQRKLDGLCGTPGFPMGEQL